ncbi:MAG: HAMP domain-containing protein [Alphaproteobacteria bacterium]|nr:HAMP domain-containing protein [Alphaproteobacteria bacterium]
MIGKNILPKGLFGRALLILVLPTVLIQMVMAYIFFSRHWDNVTRYMSHALSGEMVFLTSQLRTMPPEYHTRMIADFEMATGIAVFREPANAFSGSFASQDFPEFRARLASLLHAPFTVRRISDDALIEVRIAFDDYTLRLLVTVKRLESRTTIIYLSWMMGVSVLFLIIAVLFLRNQIRPINRLAEAADDFGRGMDSPDFRPGGAREVRKAARAFIVMKERIFRQVRTRTEMLASISHDLRTPLTRMKLQLAMLADSDAARELKDDVQQMEHMIQEYLDFVRGEGGEEASQTALDALLADVVEDYRRLKADVRLAARAPVQAAIKVSAFRRMLHNVIDNALRYGKRCEVSLVKSVNYCEILVDDEGEGIPQEKREEVFRPFSRLDASRNLKSAGVGLGLTIARDIAQAHGGSITLDTSPKAGLRVRIRLPL